MKKGANSIILLMTLALSAYSQTYTFVQSKTYLAYLDTNQLLYTKGVEVINTGTTNLDLSWELILNDTLPDAEFDLCNSGECFANLPASGNMPTLLPGEKGWLKVHMWAGKTYGTNTAKYILRNGMLQSDTLTFIMIVGEPSSVKTVSNYTGTSNIYPNPSSGKVVFSTSSPETYLIRLIDSKGKIIINHSGSHTGQYILNIESVPDGEYFLDVQYKSGRTETHKLIKQ